MNARQKQNVKMVSSVAKELRYAGYRARADHGMVQIIVKGISDLELQKLQNIYDVSMICQ